MLLSEHLLVFTLYITPSKRHSMTHSRLINLSLTSSFNGPNSSTITQILSYYFLTIWLTFWLTSTLMTKNLITYVWLTPWLIQTDLLFLLFIVISLTDFMTDIGWLIWLSLWLSQDDLPPTSSSLPQPASGWSSLGLFQPMVIEHSQAK